MLVPTPARDDFGPYAKIYINNMRQSYNYIFTAFDYMIFGPDAKDFFMIDNINLITNIINFIDYMIFGPDTKD